VAWNAIRGLFGGRCPVCRRTQAAPGLCPACAEALGPRGGGFCPLCAEFRGLPSAPPEVCPACRAAPPPWGRLFFHAGYDGPLGRLIAAYKFERRLSLGRLLQGLLASAFDPARGLPDLIAPVPLTRRRLLWRGYNQSLELSRLLARRIGRPIRPKALTRVRATAPQVRLAREARQENVRGAFAADPAIVAGLHCLVVDDVTTTGATLRECALALLEAGAARVDALVLAKAE
jgi:ComF family protein